MKSVFCLVTILSIGFGHALNSGRAFSDASVQSIMVDPEEVQEPATTDRPVIGILAQALSYYLMDHLPPGHGYTSYIGAAYVKFVESAGARVVPVFVNRTDEYYEDLFSSLNGVLFPGGAVSIEDSGYAYAGRKFFDLSRQAMDERGERFPIWGTCLGFEMLAYLGNHDINPLSDCDSYDKASPISIVSPTDWYISSLGNAMPSDVQQTLTGSDATVNFHHFCVTPENFTNFGMDEFFLPPLATSVDSNGLEYIALLESRDYPMWGSQFHPEKLAYEWTTKYDNIPHDRDSVHAANFFAEFFVEAARSNGHSFPSRAEEEEALIYAYQPEYTGREDIDYSMVQSYLFKDD